MARLYVFDYSFTMKYILLAVFVVFITRIDFFVNLFQSISARFINSANSDNRSAEVISDTKLIPLKSDQVFKTDARLIFLSILEDFRTDTSGRVREQAMQILSANPGIFSEKADLELEAVIYRWQDLMIQNNPEVHLFLQALLLKFNGENAAMVRRFYSLGMDGKMDTFFEFYITAKDEECQVGASVPYPVSRDEKIDQLTQRLFAIEALVKNNKLKAAINSLALKCISVIEIEREKIRSELPKENEDNSTEEDLNNSVPSIPEVPQL
jgi:hypothetical protein